MGWLFTHCRQCPNPPLSSAGSAAFVRRWFTFKSFSVALIWFLAMLADNPFFYWIQIRRTRIQAPGGGMYMIVASRWILELS
jgi:hypothetical protein